MTSKVKYQVCIPWLMANSHKLSSISYQLLAISVVAMLVASCNPAKRVVKGHYLLTRNVFRYRSGTVSKKITHVIESSEKNLLAEFTAPDEIAPEQILAYVKQKPNTRLLGVAPLYLWIYNIYDSAKTEQRKLARNQRMEIKFKKENEKRISEGKLPLGEAVIKARKQKKTFREKVMSSGEHPVILDSNLLNRSRRQISLFLPDKGYYNCKVRDSVVVKHKKATVYYIIIPGKPYKIAAINYTFADTSIAKYVYSDTSNCLIRPGVNFDYDIFLKEQARITRKLNDDGYFAFTKQYINFVIDSSLGNQKMKVTIDVNKFIRTVKNTINQDSTMQIKHIQYHFRNVTIQMQFDPGVKDYYPADTLTAGNYVMVDPTERMGFKPKILIGKTFIHPGDLYQISNVDNTYTGLAQLKAFRYVNVKLVPVASDSNLLDCYIQLMPVVKQSLSLEAEGDNTGGDLGVQGDIIYENKNCFQDAEDLQFKIKGGFEAQTFGSNAATGTFTKIIPLNTVDIGPELDLRIPRPTFPFNLFNFKPKANPQSGLKFFFDYQNRPTFYNRNLFGVSYGIDWNESKTVHFSLKLPEVSYVHANLYKQFQDTLDATHNFFLLNSFSNHLITDINLTMTLNTQDISKVHSFNFFKVSAEESGYVLQEIGHLAPHTGLARDTLLGVPYSYYIKGEVDYRHYFVFSKFEQLVFRITLGAGVPLGNTDELPFDKSFWAGGSNDERGWLARSLGPGASPQSDLLDEIGDTKVEQNWEYRFNLIKFLNLAFFSDLGNIWTHFNNPAIPNSSFIYSGPFAWYNELAWDLGTGIRFDFTYFVFRLDFGFPIHDPAISDKWFNVTNPIERYELGFGIGYPF